VRVTFERSPSQRVKDQEAKEKPRRCGARQDQIPGESSLCLNDSHACVLA
jgi:hypothetical protein